MAQGTEMSLDTQKTLGSVIVRVYTKTKGVHWRLLSYKCGVFGKSALERTISNKQFPASNCVYSTISAVRGSGGLYESKG